jgi:comEA protein
MMELPGFTRREAGVLLFLVLTFIAGMGIQVYRQHWAPLPAHVAETAVLEIHSSAEPILGKEEIRSSEIEKPAGRISLNRASREELEKLPGVGTVTAGRIIDYRNGNGSFQSVEELVRVKGIGKKTVKKLEPYLKLD